MPQTFRDAKPYRSMLFVPGNKPDWIKKAPKYGPDALILDLEDSVPLEQKPQARQAVAYAIPELRDQSIGRFVRINGWRTGCLIDDLSAVVIDGLDGVMLSKTEDPEDVAALDRVLGELERSRGLPIGRVEICPYPETAVAMYKLHAICMASLRVKRAGSVSAPLPGGDGARALGLQLADESVEGVGFGAYSVLQVRAAGIVHVEGSMTSKLDDPGLVRRICEKSKSMGASWASAIHPSHIPIINEVYSPSEHEVEEARGLVAAMAEAIERGQASVRYKSSMVDYAHVRAAMETIKRAEAAGIDVGNIPVIQLPAF